MSGSINKVISAAIERYCKGESIPQVADDMGLSRSTLRYHLYKAGKTRPRAEAVRLAAQDGRLGSGMRGKARNFTDAHRKNISEARKRWANSGNCLGVSLKPNGYIEFTRGPHKGRLVHVVQMEKRLNRRLREDECIHHIDGDKTNNEDNNLALVTKSGHTRLHRREDQLTGRIRERQENGRFN